MQTVQAEEAGGKEAATPLARIESFVTDGNEAVKQLQRWFSRLPGAFHPDSEARDEVLTGMSRELEELDDCLSAARDTLAQLSGTVPLSGAVVTRTPVANVTEGERSDFLAMLKRGFTALAVLPNCYRTENDSEFLDAISDVYEALSYVRRELELEDTKEASC